MTQLFVIHNHTSEVIATTSNPAALINANTGQIHKVGDVNELAQEQSDYLRASKADNTKSGSNFYILELAKNQSVVDSAISRMQDSMLNAEMAQE